MTNSLELSRVSAYDVSYSQFFKDVFCLCLRKSLVMINSEEMREKLKRPTDKAAAIELTAFKKEHNKE